MKVPDPKIERASPAASHSADSCDVNSLAEFAQSAWSMSFLPTLYDRLGRASNPFMIDSDMVKVIQEIVDIVYPYADYKVSVDDRIFTMVSVLSFTFSFQMTDINIGKGSSL